MNFSELHNQQTPLLIGNAWDVLSAIIFEQSGFSALGTTSWGIANSLGFNDGEKISFNQYLESIDKIISSVKIPISVDIERGFSSNNEQVIDNILALAEKGVVGINIEDTEPTGALKNINDHAKLLEQIKSALINKGHANFFINARTDTYLTKRELPEECSRVPETMERIKAYQQAGADGVFIPNLKLLKEIEQITAATHLPVNIMCLPDCADLKALKNAGVKRISFGNALSDSVISCVEQLCHKIKSERLVSFLFYHPPVKTSFKD